MKKLKSQYRHSQVNVVKLGSKTTIWIVYASLRSVCHKHFSTKQEKSFYFLHKIDCCGFPIKLRAARGRVLADPWNDYPSSVAHVAKSWKHNSKRRKQYYR